MTGPFLLEVDGLKAGYGNAPVLHGVSLRVKRGEIVALLGVNGSGKSTLLKTLSGLITPSAGKIVFDGNDITSLPPHRIVSLGLVQIAEGRRIFRSLSVRDNLELGVYGLGLPRSEIVNRIDSMFHLFPMLSSRAEQLAGSLSGGQQQMLALAQGVIRAPRLLLIDELSLGLAPLVVASMLEALNKLRRSIEAILVVEQSIQMISGVADRAHVMQTGRLSPSLSREELSDSQLVSDAYFGKVS